MHAGKSYFLRAYCVLPKSKAVGKMRSMSSWGCYFPGRVSLQKHTKDFISSVTPAVKKERVCISLLLLL